jgi:hypothetical protein
MPRGKKKTRGKKKPTRSLLSPVWLDQEDLNARGIKYSRNHLRRMWERGDFPRPFLPTPRKLVWRADDIDAWVKERQVV